MAGTVAGAREIRPQDGAEVGRDIRVMDMRDRDELMGPLGHVLGSALLPLFEARFGAGGEVSVRTVA